MKVPNKLRLIEGDCMEHLAGIGSGSIDMVMADPPYGITSCKWDSIIPLEPLWDQLSRVVKPYSAIVLMGIQPFTTALIGSNPGLYKYNWLWMKERPSNFFQAKYAPLNQMEDIVVFSLGGCNRGSKIPMVYNPQGVVSIDETRTNRNTHGKVGIGKGSRKLEGTKYKSYTTNYPKTLLRFPTESRGGHPTQKPVALMEYLIRTYTNPGHLVLDFCMGSGTTGIACINSGRGFIGIERDQEWFSKAKERILNHRRVS